MTLWQTDKRTDGLAEVTLYNSLSVVCLSQADTICEGKWS